MAHLYTFDKCDIACHAPGARRIAFVVYCSLEPAGLDSEITEIRSGTGSWMMTPAWAAGKGIMTTQSPVFMPGARRWNKAGERVRTERHRGEGKARQAANVPTPAPLADGRRIYLDSTRIVDALHQPLLLLDKKLRVVFLNRAFCRTFMVSADEALGRDLAAIGDPHAAALRDALT